MVQYSEDQEQRHANVATAEQQDGCYVYCVALCGQEASLGNIGIENREVYTVVYRDLCALVHDCPARPYQCDDAEVAAAWVLVHHRVVDAAWKRWGTVLPLVFNTIIKAEQGDHAGNLVAWLETEYEALKGKLEALAGKAEYGVQVFWDLARISQEVAVASREIKTLQEEIGAKPRGLAYMYRQKLESILKKEIEARAAQEFQALYRRLSPCADTVHVEKTKRDEQGHQMLMNLSCLVAAERYRDLEAELDKISNREGFFVRLVGPLPPYSFC